jgi:hypothetical protein
MIFPFFDDAVPEAESAKRTAPSPEEDLVLLFPFRLEAA